jgi:hypothetical protein
MDFNGDPTKTINECEFVVNLFNDFVEIEWTLVMDVDFNEFLMDFINGL